MSFLSPEDLDLDLSYPNESFLSSNLYPESTFSRQSPTSCFAFRVCEANVHDQASLDQPPN
jgi:hypothetical protein